MSIFGWGQRPKPEVKTVPVETDDTEKWLADITQKAVTRGAILDTRTKAEIVKENMTHVNAGQGWIQTRKHLYDEKTVNQDHRLTPEQEEGFTREERETDVRLVKIARR